MSKNTNTRLTGLAVLAVALSTPFLTGCPIDGGTGDRIWTVEEQAEYDAGFAEGFAEDGEYWQGFDDSMDTVDFGPIYYQGSSIPYLESPPYDAGYYDGVWYAYNDGYFVAYDYAFTIGFSEGYDLAFSPDWPDLLASDLHVEYLDGGWSDGYNDGFSEGRVFGAWDYENGWAFDWLYAMWDYRDGTDLEIGGVSTGNNGPVYLYEYGVDPNDLVKSSAKTRLKNRPVPSIRKQPGAKTDIPDLSYRSLPTDVQSGFEVEPLLSPRSDRQLQLGTTWLERINAYLGTLGGTTKTKRPSRALTNG